MKFVLAIFVIGIHAGAEVGDRMNDVLWYVASFAVSYFFIASGFFLRRKLFDERFNLLPAQNGLTLYLKRICVLFVIWSFIYFPSELYLWLQNDYSFVRNISTGICEWVTRGKIGFGVPLWYLWSLLLGGVFFT